MKGRALHTYVDAARDEPLRLAFEIKEKATMGYIIGRTRGGSEWTPRFVKSVDENKCIGCGRCMKICAHGVIGPKEVDEEESAKMYCAVLSPNDCIGCEACGRTCSKKAFSFEPLMAT